jgi:hypothetical protein
VRLDDPDLVKLEKREPRGSALTATWGGAVFVADRT